MNTDQIEQLVQSLQLLPHPEGGYYRETYRAAIKYPGRMEDPFPSGRSLSTTIYFLITKASFSALHRIQSDEMWHFYQGDPLEIIEIDQQGKLHQTIMGSDTESDQKLQYTVSAGNWFGSRVLNDGSYSLAGCTVSPGFDFRDFELADYHAMAALYPDLQNIIRQFCRNSG